MTPTTKNEAEILARIIHPTKAEFSPDAARSILALTFDAEDLSRTNLSIRIWIGEKPNSTGTTMSDLKLRFFTVNEGCLVKASQAAVIDLWEEKRPWPVADVDDLRVVSVLCDRDVKPLVWHVTRVVVRNGWITEDSRSRACQAALSSRPLEFLTSDDTIDRIFARAHHDATRQPLVDYILDGWPPDLMHQLAVALDVALHQLTKVGIGGPLFIWPTVTVRQSLEYIDPDQL